MMGIDDKDKNRMDTSDGMDEKVSILFELSISMPRVYDDLLVEQI